jgi:hypothetical protein
LSLRKMIKPALAARAATPQSRSPGTGITLTRRRTRSARHRREITMTDCRALPRTLPSSTPASLRRTCSIDAGSTQSLKGAPLRKAPGLRARHRDVVPRVVERSPTAERTGMFGDDPPVLADYDAVGIGMNLDRTPDCVGCHRVLVVVEASTRSYYKKTKWCRLHRFQSRLSITDNERFALHKEDVLSVTDVLNPLFSNRALGLCTFANPKVSFPGPTTTFEIM